MHTQYNSGILLQENDTALEIRAKMLHQNATIGWSNYIINPMDRGLKLSLTFIERRCPAYKVTAATINYTLKHNPITSHHLHESNEKFCLKTEISVDLYGQQLGVFACINCIGLLENNTQA